jgi:hypothetical protein
MESSTGNAYLRQIKDIDDALKRANKQVKTLRDKKKDVMNKMYTWMNNKGIESYGDVTVQKLAPRPRAKRKPAKQKRTDAINLLQTIGVDDPEAFLEEFEKTQKYIPDEDE